MSRVGLVYLRGSAEERALVRNVYVRFELEGTARRVFMDGTVTSAEAFEADLFRPGSLPFLVSYDGEPCGVSWLNTIEGRSARGHYALFRAFWGRRRTIEIGRGIFRHYLGLRDARGDLFDVLIGIAPACNPLAWKLALLCGAKQQCVLPHFAYNAGTGLTEDAVLTTTTRESLEESPCGA